MRRIVALVGLLTMSFVHYAAAEEIKAAAPAFYLAFSSDQHTLLEITRLVDPTIMRRLRDLTGVAGIAVFGEGSEVTRLKLDSRRLAAYGLTPQEVIQALSRWGIKVAQGRIESGSYELIVLPKNEPLTPEKLEEVMLKATGGAAIRLRDVAQVEIGVQVDTIVNFRGNRVVAIGVVQQWWATPSVVLASVQVALPTIQALLPVDVKIDIGDQSTISIEQVPNK